MKEIIIQSVVVIMMATLMIYNCSAKDIGWFVTSMILLVANAIFLGFYLRKRYGE